MKDLDPKDTYTRIFLNPIKKKLSYCPDTKQSLARSWVNQEMNKISE